MIEPLPTLSDKKTKRSTNRFSSSMMTLDDQINY